MFKHFHFTVSVHSVGNLFTNTNTSIPTFQNWRQWLQIKTAFALFGVDALGVGGWIYLYKEPNVIHSVWTNSQWCFTMASSKSWILVTCLVVTAVVDARTFFQNGRFGKRIIDTNQPLASLLTGPSASVTF